MSTLWTVVRVEWRNVASERAVWTVLVLFAVLAAYAAWGGWRRVELHSAFLAASGEAEIERRRALQQEAAKAAGSGERPSKDPTDPLLVGRDLAPALAGLAPAPLASIAVGLRESTPQVVRITTDSRVAAHQADAPMTGFTRLLTGPFDLAFVFVYLLPLVIIALTHDVLSSERERGTLALVLSQPVSLRAFVLGKALQRGMIVLGATLGVALGAMAFAGAGLASATGLIHGALTLALLTAYATFWFCAAVAVNARPASTSAGNALALVGLWLVLVIVVPGLVSVAVDVAYPPPSRIELVNVAREAAREAESELANLEGDHGAKPADARSRVADRAVAVQEALESRTRPLVDAFQGQLEGQRRLVNRLRFLSPAIVLHEAMADVAGSGTARQQRFMRQVDEFHGQWRAFFFERVRSGARLTARDYDAMPRFAFEEEPAGELAGRIGWGLLGMLLPAGLLAAWSRSRLERVGRLA